MEEDSDDDFNIDDCLADNAEDVVDGSDNEEASSPHVHSKFAAMGSPQVRGHGRHIRVAQEDWLQDGAMGAQLHEEFLSINHWQQATKLSNAQFEAQLAKLIPITFTFTNEFTEEPLDSEANAGTMVVADAPSPSPSSRHATSRSLSSTLQSFATTELPPTQQSFAASNFGYGSIFSTKEGAQYALSALHASLPGAACVNFKATSSATLLTVYCARGNTTLKAPRKNAVDCFFEEANAGRCCGFICQFQRVPRKFALQKKWKLTQLSQRAPPSVQGNVHSRVEEQAQCHPGAAVRISQRHIS